MRLTPRYTAPSPEVTPRNAHYATRIPFAAVQSSAKSAGFVLESNLGLVCFVGLDVFGYENVVFGSVYCGYWQVRSDSLRGAPFDVLDDLL